MIIRLHVYNERWHLDPRVYIEVDVPSAPNVGDTFYLSEEQFDSLIDQIERANEANPTFDVKGFYESFILTTEDFIWVESRNYVNFAESNQFLLAIVLTDSPNS